MVLDEAALDHQLKYWRGIFSLLSVHSERSPLFQRVLALTLFTWLGRDGVEFPHFLGLLDPAWHLTLGALWWDCGCQLVAEVFPEGLLSFFRKTSLGLLIPQPLALPLSGTTLGSGPSALEGDQEPASSVFSGSSAPLEHLQVSYTPGAFPGPVPLVPSESLGTRVWTQEACCLPPLKPSPGGGWPPRVLA